MTYSPFLPYYRSYRGSAYLVPMVGNLTDMGIGGGTYLFSLASHPKTVEAVE